MNSSSIVKPHDVSAGVVSIKEDTQNADMKTHFERKDNETSTIKQSNTAHVARKKFNAPLSVTRFMVKTKAKGLLHFYADRSLVA